MIGLGVNERVCIWNTFSTLILGYAQFFLLDNSLNGVSVCKCVVMCMSVWSVKKKEETQKLNIYTLSCTHGGRFLDG